MTPGDRLRAARLAAGYKSVAKAALALGLPESSYRAHENGQNSFTAEQAAAYAKTFGVTVAHLAFGESEVSKLDRLVAVLVKNGTISPDEAGYILGPDA